MNMKQLHVRFISSLMWLCAALMLPGLVHAEVEEDFYPITAFEPGGIELEVSGLTVLADNRPLVATRGGEVFLVEGAHGDPKAAKFKPFAFGLSTPLGLLEQSDGIYVAQRGELTRMKDTDGDGRADWFDTISDQWELGGNYHEYAFGPVIDKQGMMWVTLNKPFGDQPYGDVPWRGWAMRIDPKTGATTPVAAGLRSPSGIEVSPAGDVFYSDNQGEWCNASKLSQLEPGDFHGHPFGSRSASLPRSTLHAPLEKDLPAAAYMKDLSRTIPNFKMPAVWLPYDKAGQSPTGFRWDTTGGKFGPFAGQVFLGDQHHASLLRISLEKIKGRWQGAVYPFLEGFQSGLVRVAFSKDGALFAGMTNAGWGGRGTRPYGLARVNWTGKVPFEVKEIKATPRGFTVEFTQPVNEASARAALAFKIKSYTYRLRKDYGGPEEDVAALTARVASISGTKVELFVDNLRAGYVHEFDLADVRSHSGGKLLHAAAYYSLIQIP
ncbi:MAG: hypothetical protein SF187_02825 [Deltaproteobacteria bacterium]|nr:hypothetical protein [Deltaproteobacteria bacterium]